MVVVGGSSFISIQLHMQLWGMTVCNRVQDWTSTDLGRADLLFHEAVLRWAGAL